MRTCKVCNTQKPLTEFTGVKRKSYTCIACAKQKKKEWHQRNYQQNKQKFIRQAKAWHKDNPEKVKAKRLKWAKANKDKIYTYSIADKPYVYIAKHNDFYYIGCTKRVWFRRFSDHKCHTCTTLGKYIQEHNLSKKDFTVEIFECETKRDARILERELIIKHDGNLHCLNKKIPYSIGNPHND